MRTAPRLDAATPEQNVVGSLSPWYPWDARGEIPDENGGFARHYEGVYLLAHFLRRPSGLFADPLDERIIYIGEGRHLGRRWYQFERSAKHGLSGHSGGHTYRAWASKTMTSWDTLHVAAYPIWFESEGDTDEPQSLARRFRLYLEQKLLFDLVSHRKGRTGLCLLNVK